MRIILNYRELIVRLCCGWRDGRDMKMEGSKTNGMKTSFSCNSQAFIDVNVFYKFKKH